MWRAGLFLQSSCLSLLAYLSPLALGAQAVSSSTIPWALHAVSCFCDFTPALPLLRKPLLLVGQVDVFIPGSLSLSISRLHLDGLLRLPRRRDRFLLGAPTWSCSAITALVTNGDFVHFEALSKQFHSCGDCLICNGDNDPPLHEFTMRIERNDLGPV